MSQSPISRFMDRVAVATLIAGAVFASTPAQAEPLALVHPDRLHLQGFPNPPTSEDQSSTELNANLRRQIINYSSHEAPGTIIIDTASTHLYLVLGGDKAIRYGIGVGREGFTWQGVRTIERKVEWPDWFPPAEMLARQPYLPRFVAGGPGNPLGARALYLSGTLYRIHGTNDPSTIGKHVSSGCIRMVNGDVSDLYARVNVGTKVIVQGDSKSRNVLAEEQSKSGTKNQRSSLTTKALTLVNDVHVRGVN
jgi:lipoprotein-anchoring transpeptidase ErfK/SrfK